MTNLKSLVLASILGAFSFSAYGQAISDLPGGSVLDGTEVAPFVQSGNTVQITADQIVTFTTSEMVAAAHTWGLDQIVPYEVYDATNWNGSLEVPTKDAVRDVIEGVVSSGITDGDKGDLTVSSSGTVWDIDSGVITTAEIASGTVNEDDLKVVDTPADEECLEYESTTGDFEWEACAAVTDGDKGDITISSSGTAYDIDSDVVISGTLPLIEFEGTDAGAAGVVLKVQHDSSSPAASDVPFDLQVFAGTDDEEIGRISYLLTDGATTTEDGYWRFHADVAGTTALQASIGAGVVVGTGTTFPGAGNLALGSASVINWNNSDVTLTHRSNGLTIAGASATDGALSMDLDANVGWRAFDVTNINTGSSAGAGMSVQNGTVFAEFSAYSFGNWAAVETESGDFRIGTEAADDLVFRTNDTIRWTLDSSGKLFNGATSEATWVASSVEPQVQIEGTSAATTSLSIARFDNTATNPGGIHMGKSRGAVGVYTIVQNNDGLGVINWSGADGTDFARAATIFASVDGTPGATNDMPGRITFATYPDGSETTTNRWVISSAGRLTGPLASTALSTIDGSQTPAVQILGTGSSGHDDSSLALARFTSNAFAPVLTIAKSRGATVGSYTVVQDDDQVGHVSYEAADGTDLDGVAGVSAYVDSATIATDSVAGRLVFGTQAVGGTSVVGRWRVSNGGQLTGPLADDPQPIFESSTFNPTIQVLGLNTNDSSIGIVRYSADTSAPHLYFVKTRGAAVAAETIVQANDNLGIISWGGADGNNSSDLAAEIAVQSGGTPGATDDMPGRMIFSVSAEASGTPTGRMVIEQDGAVVIGDSDVGVTGIGLHMDDGAVGNWYEANANGDNYKGFVAPATVTASTTCTFEDDANFIPDSCVGDGSDASDARLKTGFRLAKDTGLIDQIKVYDFEWNVDAPQIAEAVRKGKHGLGVKAQELYEIAPDLVHVGGSDPLADPWTWKPEKLVPHLILEIQSLRKRVSELEAR
jgi:hypothetical protein